MRFPISLEWSHQKMTLNIGMAKSQRIHVLTNKIQIRKIQIMQRIYLSDFLLLHYQRMLRRQNNGTKGKISVEMSLTDQVPNPQAYGFWYVVLHFHHPLQHSIFPHYSFNCFTALARRIQNLGKQSSDHQPLLLDKMAAFKINKNYRQMFGKEVKFFTQYL